MNWSELKNNKSHLFLNYLKIKADKFVKDTKCHLCLKSFGYKCTLVENELTSYKWKLFELQHNKSANWQSNRLLDLHQRAPILHDGTQLHRILKYIIINVPLTSI